MKRVSYTGFENAHVMNFSACAYQKQLHTLVLFTGLVFCATYGLPVIAFEQEYSGTLCDDCHEDHKQVYWEYLVVTELEALDELVTNEEVTIRLQFFADCNTNSKSTFQRVEISLISENETLSIVDANRTVYNVVRGESNGRTIEWSVTPQRSGSDTLLVHLDGYNTHDGGFHILTDARQPVDIAEEPPDVSLNDEDIHLGSSEVIRGQVVNISVMLHNAGGVGNANVSLYVDELTATHRYDFLAGIPLIPDDDQHLVLQLDTATLEGNHTLIVVVENVTPADADPNDQQAVIPLVVHPPGNLQLMDVAMAEGLSLLNETVEVVVRAYSNFTFVMSVGVELELMDPITNTSHIETYNILLEAANETVVTLNFTIVLSQLPSDNITLSIHLDPTNAIPEIVEADNYVNLNVTLQSWIPPFELRVGPVSLTPLPDLVVAGLPVTINVTVVNLGNKTATVNLTIQADSGGETHLLEMIPLVLTGGERLFCSITWDTTDWNDSVVLNFDVDELEGEISHIDNHLSLALMVRPPPWLAFVPDSLQSVSIVPAGLLPVVLTIQLAEHNGTPATGVVRLIHPMDVGSEAPFNLEGGGTTTLIFSVVPSIGKADYRLEIEAYGRTETLHFILVATDPREALTVDIVTLSPQPAQSGTLLMFSFTLDWNHTTAITASLSPWLVPVGGGAPVKLPVKLVTLQSGMNHITWNGLPSAGRYTVALHGEMFLPGGNLTLPALGNGTLVVVDNEVNGEEPLSAPSFGLTLVALITAATVVTRRRRW